MHCCMMQPRAARGARTPRVHHFPAHDTLRMRRTIDLLCGAAVTQLPRHAHMSAAWGSRCFFCGRALSIDIDLRYTRVATRCASPPPPPSKRRRRGWRAAACVLPTAHERMLIKPSSSAPPSYTYWLQACVQALASPRTSGLHSATQGAMHRCWAPRRCWRASAIPRTAPLGGAGRASRRAARLWGPSVVLAHLLLLSLPHLCKLIGSIQIISTTCPCAAATYIHGRGVVISALLITGTAVGAII